MLGSQVCSGDAGGSKAGERRRSPRRASQRDAGPHGGLPTAARRRMVVFNRCLASGPFTGVSAAMFLAFIGTIMAQV